MPVTKLNKPKVLIITPILLCRCRRDTDIIQPLFACQNVVDCHIIPFHYRLVLGISIIASRTAPHLINNKAASNQLHVVVIFVLPSENNW
jgi:hypothetical protein